MANADLNKWLDGIEDEAQAQLQEAAESGRKDFDNGTYVGLIIQHEFKKSSNDNHGVATKIMFLESLEPSYIGETYPKWRSLDGDGFKFLGWDLQALAIEQTDPKDIIEEMRKHPEDLFGVVENKTVIKFKLEDWVSKTDKTKTGQNCKVLKVLEDYDLSDAPEPRKPGSKKSNEGSDGGVSDEPEEDADDVARVGMRITFTTKVQKMNRQGKPITGQFEEIQGEGKITEINEDQETITVVTDDEEEFELSYAKETTDTIELVKEQAV